MLDPVKPTYLDNSVTGVVLITYLLIATCSKQCDQLRDHTTRSRKLQNVNA